MILFQKKNAFATHFYLSNPNGNQGESKTNPAHEDVQFKCISYLGVIII